MDKTAHLMNREYILDEIRRIAALTPHGKLGSTRFKRISGISEGVWRGKFWIKWTDAAKEAGVAPGEKTASVDENALLTALAELVREYKHFPTQAETKIQRAVNANFPSYSSFTKLGPLGEKINKLRQFATNNTAFTDILDFLPTSSDSNASTDCIKGESNMRTDGNVYMLKLGKHCKIGHTTSVSRRHREINLELPEKAVIVHTIATDDPKGIEAYWHRRFSDKNTNGEWFLLSSDDVRAFKRRKFM
jgi:hypothetical protein